jgi:SSS family solute:Na+ symporter
LLGLFSKVALEQGMFESLGYASGSAMDPELGLPLLLREILPVGLMGLMLSAYFSAIMSTADSCLMAASGNLTNDILGKKKQKDHKRQIRFSQLLTLAIGVLAILLATMMNEVLELMLYSYAFMVSGLLVPVLGMLFLKNPSPRAALVAMISGGLVTLVFLVLEIPLPWNLDANIVGISVSALSFILIQNMEKKVKK